MVPRFVMLLLGALFLSGSTATRTAAAKVSSPVVLWAWERPEDLRFLGARLDIGVAFLGETLILDGDQLRTLPRRQPLLVSDTTPLEAVVRVEWVRGRPIADSAELRARVVERFVAAAALPRVHGVQLDFDAPASAHPFYRALLAEIRAALPKGTRLSMTAVASWCMNDPSWIESVAPIVDEIVPMVFTMGPDTRAVWAGLDVMGGFASAACESSVGVALHERIPRLARNRKAYLFNRHAWTRDDFDEAMRTVRRGDESGGEG